LLQVIIPYSVACIATPATFADIITPNVIVLAAKFFSDFKTKRLFINMQEFLSLYSKMENPTLEMVLFTFLLAFLCSVSIGFTYYFTTPTTLKTANYIQALVLSSVIATMILQSIGDNVASGLGIIGALTIINFRTAFRDPRDIIFMFAALGVGIACGSYVFVIAAAGTAMFCALGPGAQVHAVFIGQSSNSGTEDQNQRSGNGSARRGHFDALLPAIYPRRLPQQQRRGRGVSGSGLCHRFPQ
jgi:hypothetical protein